MKVRTNGQKANVVVDIKWKTTFVVISVNGKLVEIPTAYKDKDIGAIPKRGRKKTVEGRLVDLNFKFQKFKCYF